MARTSLGFSVRWASGRGIARVKFKNLRAGIFFHGTETPCFAAGYASKNGPCSSIIQREKKMTRNKRCCVTADEDDKSLMVISFFYWDKNIEPQVFHFQRPRTEVCEKTLRRMIKTMTKEAQTTIERRRKEQQQRKRDAIRKSSTRSTTESDEEQQVTKAGGGGGGGDAPANNHVDTVGKTKPFDYASGDSDKIVDKSHRQDPATKSRPVFNIPTKNDKPEPNNGSANDEAKPISTSEKPSPVFYNKINNRQLASEYMSIRILRADDQQPVESIGTDANEKLFTAQHLLAIDDSFVYTIQVNVPHCVSISVPRHLMIDFRNYAGIELENCPRETSKFFWMRPKHYDKHPDDIVIPDKFDAEFFSLVQAETNLADEEIEHWWEELYNAFYFSQWQICGRQQAYTPVPSDFGVPLKVLCIPIDARGVAGAPKFIVGCGGGNDSTNSSDSAESTFSIEWGPSCTLPFMTRKFLPIINEHASPDNITFRAVSYNMLFDLKPDADFSRGSQQYPNCARRVLEIGYRMQLIRRELAAYAADVFMLQECTYFMFIGHLKPLFIDELGYDGHLSLRRKRVSQSVVTLYNKQRFVLLDSYDFHINNLMPQLAIGGTHKMQRSETIFEGVAERSLENVARFPQCQANHCFILQLQEHFNTIGMPNMGRTASSVGNTVLLYGDQLVDAVNGLAHVMQVFVLRDVAVHATSTFSPRLIFTCNTHLYWHPNYPAYRLIQMQLILNKLEQIVDVNCERHNTSEFTVILCGDMNSSPERGIHELLTRGRVPASYYEWSEQDIVKPPVDDEADEVVYAGKTSPTTSQKMRANVDEVDEIDGSNFQGAMVPALFGTFSTFPTDAYPFTHYISEYNGCLDWIYYANGNVLESKNDKRMRMCSVLSMPSAELLQQWLPLPNTLFPSDHIAVGAEFDV